MSYPPPTSKPCSDCPWRRNATPGWLGPYDAIKWLGIAHSDSPVACHQTITHTDEEGIGEWDDPALRQCRGVAIFREHICKAPRDPAIETGPEDREHVFANNAEFIEYHTGEKLDPMQIIQAMIRDNGEL